MVYGRIVGPGIVPAYIVVLEVAAVGSGIGYPEGRLVGFVVEEAVVADYFAVVGVCVGYYLLVGVRGVVAAGFCAAVGFGEGVVAVATFVEGVACTESRCTRCRDFVVGEPGVEAGGCEALGAAVEGADGGAFVSCALDFGVCAVVIYCAA